MTARRQRLTDAEFSQAANRMYSEIRSVGRHQWEHVLRALGSPMLVSHVDKAAGKGGKPRGGECPGHGGKDGFALMADWNETGGGNCWTCGPQPSGTILLAWDRGWTHWEASLEVANFLGVDTTAFDKNPSAVAAKPFVAPTLSDEAKREIQRRAEAQKGKDARRERELTDLLGALKPIDWKSRSCPVVRYFEYRGLGPIRDDPPSDIYVGPVHKWSARENHGDQKWVEYGAFPNFVSVLRGQDGLVCGAQRVYVTDAGEKPFADIPKATRPDHKLTVGLPSYRTLRGGSVRLYNAERTLGIGEGVETMLGLRLFMAKRKLGRRMAVWSTLTTSGLRSAWVPDHCNSLQLFLDNDAPKIGRDGRVVLGAGLAAGLTMRGRMLERGGSKLFIPPAVGKDWLDVFLEYELSMNKLNIQLADSFGVATPEPFSWGMRNASLNIVASESGSVLLDPEVPLIGGGARNVPAQAEPGVEPEILTVRSDPAPATRVTSATAPLQSSDSARSALPAPLQPAPPMLCDDFDSEMIDAGADEDLALDFYYQQEYGDSAPGPSADADVLAEPADASDEPGWIVVRPGAEGADGVPQKPHVRLIY